VCGAGSLTIDLESIAEHDRELGFGCGPLAWRHLPLLSDLAQLQPDQCHRRFITPKMTAAARSFFLKLDAVAYDGCVTGVAHRHNLGEQVMNNSTFYSLILITNSRTRDAPTAKCIQVAPAKEGRNT
jgi:hypothetical protein